MSKSEVAPTQDDIIIVVLGPTGAGKSTFIQYATEKEHSAVNHSLRPSRDICLVRSKRCIDHRPLVFVDAPGFDDTYKPCEEILDQVATWLQDICGEILKIHGILYFQRISDNRMPGPSLENLELFSSTCDKNTMENVTLVTTMWSRVRKETGERREEELKQFFWNGMIDDGCNVRRFEDSIDSALDIVKTCLGEDEPLLLTQQVVDGHKALKKTQAGITLNKQLQELLKDQKDAEKRLEELASKQGNEQTRADLQKRNYEIKQKIDRISEQISGLTFRSFWPFGRRKDAKEVPTISS